MHSSLKHPAEQDGDSDWEYEYHETETETFYVTLDLSSTFTTGRPKKKPKTSTVPAAPLQPTTSAGIPDPAPQSTQTPPHPEALPQPTSELQADPSDRIQILDFHTLNPLISYQNQLYSCTWTSTIGTDLLLTTPDPTCTLPKLKESKGFDVLATTNIRLIGKPTQLIPRADPRPSRDPSPAHHAEASEASPAHGNGARVEQAATASETRIDLGPNPSPSRQNQAAFLSRLMAAKAKRGETDRVPVHAKKVLSSVGWRAQRREAVERAAQQRQEGGRCAEIDEGELVLEEGDSGEEAEGGGSPRLNGARLRTRGLTRRGRIRAAGRAREVASRITGRAQGGLVADAGAVSSAVDGIEGQDGAGTGMSFPTPRTWDVLGQGEKSGAGAMIITPTADVEMAGVEGNSSVEASPADGMVTTRIAGSSSGPRDGKDGAPEGYGTRTDRDGAAGIVLDAPDVDIPMEDAP
ncbi:MAG: hypothetical protein FRX48_02781 [Lasallia pustulata]|uniref:Transcription factor TFIIIC triple barrel domain-containing protein n=1 Tax=Lasallia pustulata TaxID=136370 RepID=A0A5M8PTU1_9LECA|nr:MAG: hypothetical protein FRX48_02781 [Lasallia pustulata]